MSSKCGEGRAIHNINIYIYIYYVPGSVQCTLNRNPRETRVKNRAIKSTEAFRESTISRAGNARNNIDGIRTRPTEAQKPPDPAPSFFLGSKCNIFSGSELTVLGNHAGADT